MIITLDLLYPEPTTQEIFDSCNKNNYAYGCETIANMYNYGGELKRNKKKAFQYYKKSCELGLSSACFQTGKIQENKARNSRKVVRGLEKAIYYYKRGCSLGNDDFPKDARSCSAAGRLINYREQASHPGRIISASKQDKVKSLILFQKACEYGDDYGCKEVEKDKILKRNLHSSRTIKSMLDSNIYV